MSEKLKTTREVGEMAGLTAQWVRQLTKQHKLPHTKAGRQVLFTEKQAQQFVAWYVRIHRGIDI